MTKAKKFTKKLDSRAEPWQEATPHSRLTAWPCSGARRWGRGKDGAGAAPSHGIASFHMLLHCNTSVLSCVASAFEEKQEFTLIVLLFTDFRWKKNSLIKGFFLGKLGLDFCGMSNG